MVDRTTTLGPLCGLPIFLRSMAAVDRFHAAKRRRRVGVSEINLKASAYHMKVSKLYPNRETNMAKNTGKGSRVGAVKGRSQFPTPSGHPAKRDTKTGRIMDVKADKTPFKGVREEK